MLKMYKKIALTICLSIGFTSSAPAFNSMSALGATLFATGSYNAIANITKALSSFPSSSTIKLSREIIMTVAGIVALTYGYHQS